MNKKDLQNTVAKNHKTTDTTVETLDLYYRRVIKENGYIPICSHCGKVRDDDTKPKTWFKPDPEIINTLPESSFSHGMCLDCFEEVYPEIFARRGQEIIAKYK